jgi:hypothetical protein
MVKALVKGRVELAGVELHAGMFNLEPDGRAWLCKSFLSRIFSTETPNLFATLASVSPAFVTYKISGQTTVADIELVAVSEGVGMIAGA